MSWTINEVARISGVTSRTLRHYQDIGLLEPESTEFSGRRLYGQLELLRLQEILLLRDLGLPLRTIARILDEEGGDRRAALTTHLETLNRERDRIDELIGTIEKTIQKGPDMTPEEIFAGIRENPFEEETRERWGDDVVDESNERLARLTPAEIERLRTGFEPLHRRIESLHEDGAPVDDPRVRETIREHLEIVSLTWSPNAAQYRALGRMYVDDERFRESIGRGNDAMVDYLAEAMDSFAEAEMRD